MTTPSMVALDNVSKTFNSGGSEVQALRQLSLSVAPREFVSIVGPSGCGKSTVLMLVAGLETASAGHVTVAGKRVVEPRAQTGIVFQDPTLLPWKTVLENVLYPGRIRGLPLEPIRQRALDLLDLLGLKQFVHSKPAQLSGGMRQRVGICRSLTYDPDLLLFDEPFSALDAITRDEMNELLLEVTESVDKATLFVTHSIAEALILSDRILVMGASPSRVIAEIVVPFERPRRMAVKSDPRFVQLSADIRALIYDSRSEHAATRSREEFKRRLANA